MSKRHWINPGRTSLWDNLLNGNTHPKEWKKNLRMTKNDFLYLVNLARKDFEPGPNHFRHASEPKKKVAMTLYYLKDPRSYLMTCNALGVGKSMLSSVVREVCHAINQRVGPDYLRLCKDGIEMSV